MILLLLPVVMVVVLLVELFALFTLSAADSRTSLGQPDDRLERRLLSAAA